MLYKHRTPEELELTIDKIANTIVEQRMETPALLFFDSIRPVSVLGAKLGGAMLAGMIPLIGYTVDDLIVPFRESENVEKVVKLIEKKTEERNIKINEEKARKKLIKVKKKKPWYWPF